MTLPQPQADRKTIIFGNVIKLSLASGLIFWLVSSGAIRPEYLVVSVADIPALLGACGVILVGLTLGALRYRELLLGAGVRLNVLESLKVTAVMYFFSQCVLGVASGDFARYVYTSRVTGPGSGAKIGAAIIADRIIGIMGLLMLAGIGMGLNWDFVEGASKLRIVAPPLLAIFSTVWLSVVLGYLALSRGRVFGFCSGIPFVVAAIIFYFYSSSGFVGASIAPVLLFSSVIALFSSLIAPEFLEEGYVFRKLFRGSKVGAKIGELLSAVLVYRNTPGSLFKTIVFTAVQHACLIISLYQLARIQNLPISPGFNEIFFAAPLSFLAGIIPAPAAGLGVNEAAFETLLSLASQGAVTSGASIYLMQRIWITVFSLGGLPLILKGGGGFSFLESKRTGK